MKLELGKYYTEQGKTCKLQIHPSVLKTIKYEKNKEIGNKVELVVVCFIEACQTRSKMTSTKTYVIKKDVPENEANEIKKLLELRIEGLKRFNALNLEDQYTKKSDNLIVESIINSISKIQLDDLMSSKRASKTLMEEVA